jgi:nucleoside-diphosphate-sugar epimerase
VSSLCDLQKDEILVTGGSGLIGVNLIKFLQNIRGVNAKKISVITKSGQLPDVGIDYKKLNVLKGDLLDLEFLKSLPKADVIFHAAGYGQPAKFLDNALGTIKLNCDVTSILAEKTHKGGRFVFFSSSEIYSGLRSLPNFESEIGTTDPYHPRAAYIEGKRMGETITHLARDKFEISSTSLRIALVYGPGTKNGDSRVLNSFISRALNDGKLLMMDRGDALRTYCFIDDAIRMIINIAERGTDNVYNLGGIEMVSIRELGELISSLTGCAFEIPDQDLGLSSAPNMVKLSMDRTLKTFDEKFEFTPFVDGLRQTIDWQKSHLH